MQQTLRRFVRLQKMREQEVHLDLVDAEQRREDQAQAVAAIGEELAEQRADRMTHCAADLARHHTWAVQMELHRRGQEAELHRRSEQVDEQRQKLRDARVATRTTELVVEAREQEIALEARRRDQHRMDERGIMGWWRRQGGSG